MTVREAQPGELWLAANVLSRAFHHDSVNCWIFPDAERRRLVHPPFYRAFVNACLGVGGDLYVTDDVSAVLVSMPGVTHKSSPDSFVAPFDFLADDERERFVAVIAAVEASRPIETPHSFPRFLGVLPERRDTCAGEELFARRLALLDAEGLPSFVVASTSQSPHLYTGLGYRHIGRPLAPHGAMMMYPMWRTPNRDRKMAV